MYLLFHKAVISFGFMALAGMSNDLVSLSLSFIFVSMIYDWMGMTVV